MGRGLRFPIVTLLINYILSLVTGEDRFHSQRTKPRPVFCHPAAPAGIPCRWANSCEQSPGHQETSPAGTFLRVCARRTTSVSLLGGESSYSAQFQPQWSWGRTRRQSENRKWAALLFSVSSSAHQISISPFHNGSWQARLEPKEAPHGGSW